MANIKMISGPAKGTKISIDQLHLQPVIPILSSTQPKPEVLIIKGMYKGNIGTLNSLDANEQKGIIELKAGDLLKLEYDCFTEYINKKK